MATPLRQEWGDGVKFDASDRDGSEDGEGMINLQDWPTVKGMYMPDSVNTFKGKTGDSYGKRCESAGSAQAFYCGVDRTSLSKVLSFYEVPERV